MKSLGIPLLLALAACPIPPDFPPDAGPDGGTTDGGSDAGVDAGTDAGVTSGNAGASLTTSTSTSSTLLAWNGSDLGATSIDAQGATGPSQVTVSAANGFSGSFKLTMGNLVPNSTAGVVLSVSYQPASGPDNWTCNASSPVPCQPNVTLQSYDGRTIVGKFAITFPQDSFGVSAQLNSGTFNVVLP